MNEKTVGLPDTESMTAEICAHLEANGYTFAENGMNTFFVPGVTPDSVFPIQVMYDVRDSVIHMSFTVFKGQALPDYLVEELYLLNNLITLTFEPLTITYGYMSSEGEWVLRIALSSITANGAEHEPVVLKMAEMIQERSKRIFHPMLSFLTNNEPVYGEGSATIAPNYTAKIKALEVIQMMKADFYGGTA